MTKEEFMRLFGLGLEKNKFESKQNITDIKHIHCDHKNKVTVVVFGDDSKTICRCAKEDEYNEYAGICICIAKHVYGKSYLDKIINSKKKVIYNNDNKEEK